MTKQLVATRAVRLWITLAAMLACGLVWVDDASAAIRTPNASGSTSCGGGTANITWTVHNYPEAPVPIVISSASMSGAATGGVTISPSSIAPGSNGTATVSVNGTAVGDVFLNAVMTSPFSFTIVGRAILDGTCAPPLPPPPPPPPPTEPPSSAAPPPTASDAAALAVAGVQPTYVG